MAFMPIELFITSGLEHGEGQMGQLLVLTLGVLLATLVGQCAFRAEVTALPVLDGHQNVAVVVDPAGTVPGAELEGWGLVGERIQRPCHLLFEGSHAASQRVSGSIVHGAQHLALQGF
jgi:hypothetical protein